MVLTSTIEVNSKDYTSSESANADLMTFILGSRCADGVVLIADRKITLNDDTGLHFEYRDKLFGELRHVVFGSSGSTGSYELFRGHVKQHIRTNNVLIDDVPLVLSDHVYTLNERYKYRNATIFDVLTASSYADKDSVLTYIDSYGLTTTVQGYQVIGSGAKYARPFIEKAWRPNMKMKQIAELGYFIIRYIEQFRLDLSVGLNTDHPQVWYLPDRYRENKHHKVIANDDRPLKPAELVTMRTRVDKRLRKYEADLDRLFG